ncbi:KRAB-A domain-containing protein 2-like [Palaemon carinicauda]|uniref:KRAB-A domain-containing protein 2-like n=1 Tax=Palaemon carinicauda TaxID=392227 RepID=UPI0035B5E43A
MANPTERDIEAHFREELFQRSEGKKSVLLPKEQYNEIISEVTATDKSGEKTPHEYYLLKKYEIFKCGDVLKLIRRRTANEDPIYFATLEYTFDIIKHAHIATGHGGRDKMVKELSKKYDNITHDAISIYKSLCIECQCKQVAYQLLDIFLLLGAPEILQSVNGSEFTACVITELKLLWPDLVMVHGKPRYPQSQGSVERANCDIKDILVAWLSDNNTTDWTVGLKFVQFQKNSSYHSGIRRSPFAALFGSDAKVGLTTSALPHDVIHRLQSEDELLAVITEETTSDELPAVEPVTAKPPAVEPVTVEPPAVEPVTAEPPAVEQVTALGVLCTTVIRVTAEPPAVKPTSPLSVRQKNNTSQRKRACEAQLSQAERMVERIRRIMDRGKVGNNVTIPIPMVDRGRGDPRNIMGIIMDIDENDNYTIAVKSGILSGKYTRNQFDLCMEEKLIIEEEEPCVMHLTHLQ